MSSARGRLTGKVALITGSGNGLGYAMTRLFVDEGAKVIAADMSGDDLAKWAAVENVVPVQADVTKLEDINRMVGEAEGRFGKLDILCNVAGINDLCYPLEETSDERWDKVLDLDLKAPFRICRRAIKGMVESGGGAIVNIGSYAAVRGNHGASYSAAKHGVIGLTLSIAVAYAKKGIRCNAINPGGMATNIGLHSGGQYHSGGIGMLRDIIGKFPVQISIDPLDVARTALWLCSDEAKHVNGAVIPVDGGMSAC